MPIELPDIPGLQNFVTLPEPPSTPPTPQDFASARVLAYQLMMAYHKSNPVVNDTHLANVMKYEHALLSSAQGGEPAWFQAAFERALGPFKTEMRLEQGKIRRICAYTHNLTCGSGDDAVLEVVPFSNGENPTQAPHNLPALTSPRVVRGLSAADRDAYIRGYGISGRTPVRQRINKIFSAIGCGPS